MAQYTGPWPERVYLAMGSKEASACLAAQHQLLSSSCVFVVADPPSILHPLQYSGTRAKPGPQWDKLLVRQAHLLLLALRAPIPSI